jgi:hypothetical protein
MWTEAKTIGAIRNAAVSHAFGDYIAHWDDDDCYGPDRLERQMQALLRCGDGFAVTARHTTWLDTVRFRAATVEHAARGVGSSLLYKKRPSPYPDVEAGEDSALIDSFGNSLLQVGGDWLITRVHDKGHTSHLGGVRHENFIGIGQYAPYEAVAAAARQWGATGIPEPPAKRTYTVVIPSKNADNVDYAVGALRARGETCRVIVVDDGVTRKRDDCEYVPGVKPFVFSRNVNIGIAAAGDDDVIIHGDDGALQGGNFAELYRPWSIVSPGIWPAVGNRRQLAGTGRGWVAEDRMLCFVAVYIPREVLRAVGPMDERYIEYGLDDDDYCWTARTQHGVALWINMDVVVDHGLVKSQFRDLQPHPTFLPNMKRFMEKWGHDNWGTPNEQSEWKGKVGL